MLKMIYIFKTSKRNKMESHHDGPSEGKRRWQHYCRMLISLPGLTTTNKKIHRLDLVFFLFMFFFFFFFVGLTTAVPTDDNVEQHLERADLGISDDVTSIKPPQLYTLKVLFNI